MPHYKDSNNRVHFLDSEETEKYLPANCVQISDEEAHLLTNPPETPEQIKARLLGEIYVLEASQFMSRGEREAWLVLMVSTAHQQNVTEAQLYQVNPFYKKLKDQDTAIKALRAKL